MIDRPIDKPTGPGRRPFSSRSKSQVQYTFRVDPSDGDKVDSLLSIFACNQTDLFRMLLRAEYDRRFTSNLTAETDRRNAPF